MVWLYRSQCSGPMTFWCGSGFGSCYFRHRPSRCQQITNFLFYFLCSLLFEDTFTFFSKIKSQKESQNGWNQGFSYYFCMMIEGSGSGSIPLTNGSKSGSRRPKNIWIRIRIRIRNRDTDFSPILVGRRGIISSFK
jgi:hypothetical protein